MDEDGDGVVDSEDALSGLQCGSPDETTICFAFDKAGNATTTDFFDGALDDIRIYNRALSQNEIQRLYDLGR